MTASPRPASLCHRSRSESNTFQSSGCRTRVPTFWRMSTSPFAASTRIASRTDVRLTPYSSESSASFGSRSPGAYRPPMIWSPTPSITWPWRPRMA